MISEFQTEQLDGSVIVKSTENQLIRFRRQFKEQFKFDILDCVNIEFVENNTKNFLEENFALSYLKNCIEIPPEKIEDRSQYPELHSELCGKDFTMPSIEQFNKCPMQINYLRAAFLIEVFCPNQSKGEKGSYNKRFMNEKTVYTLLLIAPLPISFEFDKTTQMCILKFADIENYANAELIQKQIQFAMGIFFIKICSACFYNVDCDQFTLQSTGGLSDSLDSAVLRTPNFNVSDGSGQFAIYILPNIFGEEKRNQIKMKIENIYSNVQIFQCENCKKFVSQNTKEECSTVYTEDTREDMVFDHHTLTGISTSQFQFGSLLI